MKSSRTAAKSLTTSFTSMPVSALNLAVMSFSAGERSASTHMVMVLAPEALRSGLAVAVAGAVAAAPPQALSASAATTEIAPAVNTRRLVPVVRVFCTFIGVPFMNPASTLKAASEALVKTPEAWWHRR